MVRKCFPNERVLEFKRVYTDTSLKGLWKIVDVKEGFSNNSDLVRSNTNKGFVVRYVAGSNVHTIFVKEGEYIVRDKDEFLNAYSEKEFDLIYSVL